MLDLGRFTGRAKTSWHAANEIGNGLALEDFDLLEEREPWELKPGGSYFVIRGGAVVAFRLPEEAPKSMAIVGSHTDSPGLKIKPHPKKQHENMLLLGTEVYGGPILSSWFGRDLCIAGRVTVLDSGDEISHETVCLDDMPCMIPHLAIHLDREVNKKGHLIDKQENLCPIIGLHGETIDTKGVLEKMLARHLFFKELLAFDLFLVPLEPMRFLGLNGEMISSYRLDNLLSAHACLQAIIEAKVHNSQVQMAIFWNHEEIGSGTREGACSSLFNDIFDRICASLKVDDDAKGALRSASWCISSDVAHAYHPNYGKKYDPDHHPLLGEGVVIKHNANMRYATEAESTGRLVKLCKDNSLPYQHFVSHSEIPCGSTIGPLFSTATGILTIDIGSPLMGMHAISELAACSDHRDLCKLLTAALNT